MNNRVTLLLTLALASSVSMAADLNPLLPKNVPESMPVLSKEGSKQVDEGDLFERDSEGKKRIQRMLSQLRVVAIVDGVAAVRTWLPAPPTVAPMVQLGAGAQGAQQVRSPQQATTPEKPDEERYQISYVFRDGQEANLIDGYWVLPAVTAKTVRLFLLPDSSSKDASPKKLRSIYYGSLESHVVAPPMPTFLESDKPPVGMDTAGAKVGAGSTEKETSAAFGVHPTSTSSTTVR